MGKPHVNLTGSWIRGDEFVSSAEWAFVSSLRDGTFRFLHVASTYGSRSKSIRHVYVSRGILRYASVSQADIREYPDGTSLAKLKSQKFRLQAAVIKSQRIRALHRARSLNTDDSSEYLSAVSAIRMAPDKETIVELLSLLDTNVLCRFDFKMVLNGKKPLLGNWQAHNLRHMQEQCLRWLDDNKTHKTKIFVVRELLASVGGGEISIKNNLLGDATSIIVTEDGYSTKRTQSGLGIEAAKERLFARVSKGDKNVSGTNGTDGGFER